MNRVTGIGGVFIKCENPEKQKEWYNKHLGIDSGEYGATFEWFNEKKEKCITAWSTFSNDSDYFSPSEAKFMINYRVDNLVELLNVLKSEGVDQIGEMQEFEYGKFAWILDAENNKIELWEPIDETVL